MIAELMLATSLAAIPFSPLPASDRHAEMWDRMGAANAESPRQTIDVAQYAPPAAGARPTMPPAAMEGGPQGGAGMMHGPHFLRGLGLTEAQQDSVFNLMHGQAPQMREQMKALRKAREALHAAARSDTFDEARATALAGDIARITSTIEVMHARMESAVWKLLTPEQRERAARMANGPMMMHGPWGGDHDMSRPPR